MSDKTKTALPPDSSPEPSNPSQPSTPGADDSQKVEAKTLKVATAVAELVDPVKEVLRLARSALGFARLNGVLIFFACSGLGYVGWQNHENAAANAANSKAVADVASKLDSQTTKLDAQATAVAKVTKDVEEIPRIEVRPADTTDPTSKPVAVIRPGKRTKRKNPGTPKPGMKGDPPPPPSPAGIEIPLDLPPRKK